MAAGFGLTTYMAGQQQMQQHMQHHEHEHL
jgi:hypothetical protein